MLVTRSSGRPFQSTLSVRRATLTVENLANGIVISIHALREESDPTNFPSGAFGATFQSTLSVRRATVFEGYIPSLSEFQSTLSVRRATLRSAARRAMVRFQSTLSVRRATCLKHRMELSAIGFQSTLSVRRATAVICSDMRTMRISIHALREESDCAAGHFCPLFETQASCLALSISNNTAETTNNMSKTSNWLSVSF